MLLVLVAALDAEHHDRVRRWPRIRSTASSTESGRVGSPSIERIASPSLRPPFSAGLPGNTRTAIRLPSRRPRRAPIPDSRPSNRILKSSLPRPEKMVLKRSSEPSAPAQGDVLEVVVGLDRVVQVLRRELQAASEHVPVLLGRELRVERHDHRGAVHLEHAGVALRRHVEAHAVEARFERVERADEHALVESVGPQVEAARLCERVARDLEGRGRARAAPERRRSRARRAARQEGRVRSDRNARAPGRFSMGRGV